MQSRAQFTAVRQHPDDDNRSSVEMLNMNPNADQHRDTPKAPNWVSTERMATFRDQWSGFPWRTVLIILALPLALSPIVGLAAAAEVASQSYIRGRDCYPNGLWKFSPGATWEIMDSSYFFTPNLSFGNMTFTQVKVIDIAWDLIIGRGGQLLLAWVNYRVFNEWLVYHMEQHLTSYKLYAAVAFETTTMGTLGVLAKEWLAIGTAKTAWKKLFRWLAMLCMVLSTLYVLSFPTLMAALTGYIATSEPYVLDREQNLIAFSKVDSVVYVVEDASRLGYGKPLVAGSNDTPLLQAILKYMEGLYSSNASNFNADADFLIDQPSTWTFEGAPVRLGAPSLSIKKYPYAPGWQELPASNNYFFSVDGRQGDLYNTTYMLQKSSCKPGEEYQWGFSYIFLFMVSIFNFVWSCIMVGMWFDTRRGSRMYKSGRRPGLLRSIMEYAAAIREELGEGAEHLEEEELRRRLTGSGGALVVAKQELRVTRTNTGDGEQRVKSGWKRKFTKGSTF